MKEAPPEASTLSVPLSQLRDSTMAGDEYPGLVHRARTARSHYRYFFYDKHHNPNNTDDAQWLPELPRDEEFAIFDLADAREIVDAKGNLFGLRIGLQNQVLPLGTEGQQVAEFPFTRPGCAWHGYPLWPLKKDGDVDRSRLPAPKEALWRMEEVGLLEANQRRRLGGGKHI